MALGKGKSISEAPQGTGWFTVAYGLVWIWVEGIYMRVTRGRKEKHQNDIVLPLAVYKFY